MIEYIINNLLSLDTPHVKFISPDQSILFRDALKRLQGEGYAVYWMDFSDADGELAVLTKFSNAVSGPSEMTSWGVFEDWLYDLSWIDARKSGHFFHMANARDFWQEQTLLAGQLTEELESIALHWMKKSGVKFASLYELA